MIGREQRDGAVQEVGDHSPDVGVGDVLARCHRGEPDRAVGLGPVEPARHAVGDTRTRATTHGRPQSFLALGAEPFEQPDVDVLATAEVVVHEPAGDAGGAGDVLDRDLVVGALGEQRVGGVEDLLASLLGAETAVFRRADNASLMIIGDWSRAC